MNDRELLELAAKAIGYRAVFNLADACQLWTDDINSAYIKFWNPLADLGDALGMAADLHIDISFNPPSQRAHWSAVAKTREHHYATEEGIDIYASTKRAIVRAAASIGASMP